MRTIQSVRFTDAEKLTIRQAAHAVWNEIAYDILTLVQEEGKNSIPRSHVIELVLDANRLEDQITDGDLRTKIDAASYKQLIAIVKPAFPHSHYGM